MNQQEVGYVLSSSDFLAYLDGMPTVKINDLVVSDQGVRGWVYALFPERVEVLLMDEGTVSPGQLFRKVGENLSILLGQHLIGRVVNPLGIPIDGKRINLETSGDKRSEVDSKAPGIETRKFITDQFVTGISLVDTLIPVAKGQRQLILGDAHSGKSSFLVDLIVNQAGNPNSVCIYACMGKPVTQVKSLIDTLESTRALEKTIVIATSSSDLPPLIYLAPQTAFTIAEYFQRNGKDVLLILDDMGVHAKIYREISLTSNRSPGRESYPGDIFYQHAHLMERGGNFKLENGGGSITVFPVMELNLSDYSGYIPTNLIGMTDGQLIFKASLRSQGQTPAIDYSLSVSRVGRQTQNRVHNLLAGAIRALLAEADELSNITHFSTELPKETLLLLKRKTIIEELIRQESLTGHGIEVQIFLLGLTFTSFYTDKDLSYIQRSKQVLTNLIKTDKAYFEFASRLLSLKTMDELTKTLEGAVPRLLQICK